MGTTKDRKSSRPGLETRERILEAALTTVRTEGLIGASARAIARTGDFNQALVFYHFGSIEELLLEALSTANDRRMARFEGKLASVDSLGGLVDLAVELHDNIDEPDHAALAAIVAGWSSTSEVGIRIIEILKPWDDMVKTALDRSLSGTPIASLVPTSDLAHLISALFLGIELLGRLDPDDSRTESLFVTLSGAAKLAEPVLDSMRQGDKP